MIRAVNFVYLAIACSVKLYRLTGVTAAFSLVTQTVTFQRVIDCRGGSM